MRLDVCRRLKKKLLENALRFETDVVLSILCPADITCVNGPTMREVYREFHFNKYKVMDFRMNFSKMIFLTIICVCSLKTFRQSTVLRQQH